MTYSVLHPDGSKRGPYASEAEARDSLGEAASFDCVVKDEAAMTIRQLLLWFVFGPLALFAFSLGVFTWIGLVHFFCHIFGG